MILILMVRLFGELSRLLILQELTFKNVVQVSNISRGKLRRLRSSLELELGQILGSVSCLLNDHAYIWMWRGVSSAFVCFISQKTDFQSSAKSKEKELMFLSNRWNEHCVDLMLGQQPQKRAFNRCRRPSFASLPTEWIQMKEFTNTKNL